LKLLLLAAKKNYSWRPQSKCLSAFLTRVVRRDRVAAG
jgi:hypothetical protein